MKLMCSLKLNEYQHLLQIENVSWRVILLFPAPPSPSQLDPNSPSGAFYAMALLRNLLVSSPTLWQARQTPCRAVRGAGGARVAGLAWQRPDKGEGVGKVSKIRWMSSSSFSSLSPRPQLPAAREPGPGRHAAITRRGDVQRSALHGAAPASQRPSLPVYCRHPASPR